MAVAGKSIAGFFQQSQNVFGVIGRWLDGNLHGSVSLSLKSFIFCVTIPIITYNQVKCYEKR